MRERRPARAQHMKQMNLLTNPDDLPEVKFTKTQPVPAGGGSAASVEPDELNEERRAMAEAQAALTSDDVITTDEDEVNNGT